MLRHWAVHLAKKISSPTYLTLLYPPQSYAMIYSHRAPCILDQLTSACSKKNESKISEATAVRWLHYCLDFLSFDTQRMDTNHTMPPCSASSAALSKVEG
jgi:hypothetical protein